MGRASRLRTARKQVGQLVKGDAYATAAAPALIRARMEGVVAPTPPTAAPSVPWEPLYRTTIAVHSATGVQVPLPPNVALYGNDLYSLTVRTLSETELLIGYHRRDRQCIRDWRHEQQMKNEVAGEEAWGVMVYPPESRLVDSSNEFWILVRASTVPFPYDFLGSERLVLSPRDAAKVGAVQRPWEAALTPDEFKAPEQAAR